MTIPRLFLGCVLVFGPLFAEPAGAEPLLVCGGAEVYVLETSSAAGQPVEKLWSWRAKDHDELPENLRQEFGTTDDCKPLENGHEILISSSGGGCALVEYPSGRVTWFAHVPNAHSLELLPHRRVVVASSTNEAGNRLVLFDLARPNVPIFDTSLPAAHGVVWDAQRQRLWALGESELRSYELRDWESAQPSLHLDTTDPLPNPAGHDLQALPESEDLILSTGAGVYLFDRTKQEFRAHPILGAGADIKSTSTQPATHRTVFTKATEPNWWSDTLHFLSPEGEIRLPAERLYKARWASLSK